MCVVLCVLICDVMSVIRCVCVVVWFNVRFQCGLNYVCIVRLYCAVCCV